MGLLEKKICLVTGANRGIGEAVARRFAEEGGIVYASARKAGSLEETAERYPGRVLPVYFDVTEDAAVRQAVLRIRKEQGRLDVLVNNAAIMQDALIGMVSRSLMQTTFETNVFAVMQFLQTAAGVMKRQGSGSIINFASIVGAMGNPGQLVYSASKGAVIALTRTAAKELAPAGIRVNAVSPGVIDTELHKGVRPEIMAERVRLIGMGRMGTPEEVADACVYLASDLSLYVTGQILGVDGAETI